MHVMEVIRDVRKGMDNISEKNMFHPLQETLLTLKAHGMDLLSLPKINDKTLQDYLDDAPMAWDIG